MLQIFELVKLRIICTNNVITNNECKTKRKKENKDWSKYMFEESFFMATCTGSKSILIKSIKSANSVRLSENAQKESFIEFIVHFIVLYVSNQIYLLLWSSLSSPGFFLRLHRLLSLFVVGVNYCHAYALSLMISKNSLFFTFIRNSIYFSPFWQDKPK